MATAQARQRLGRISLGAGMVLTLLCAPVLAAGPTATAAAPANGAGWLQRIQQAAASSSYQGTLMFSAGGVVSSSRVLHYCDGRQRYERLELLDGRARVQYRHNDQMLTVWPTSKTAQAEQRDPVADFPALPAAAATRALDNYELRLVGQERVAGRHADVLMLKPRDTLRYTQRLWADHDSGLLLRNDVLGPAGELLESSSFVEVQVGARPQPEPILRAMKQLDGYRVLRPQTQATQLEAEGWVLAKSVPGFQMVSCTRRALDVTGDADPPVQVLQTVFSDGLTHVSVFIEPFDAQRHQRPMGTSLGALHTLMTRRGDWWITVVGEVPMATVQQFEAMLQRKR
jgi:sigma-E factor negative regulatory protein RseB